MRRRSPLCTLFPYTTLFRSNLVTARNITADLQGDYPWSENHPLLLSNVKVETLGGKITLQQLRMPQHDPALLRVDNISSSELIRSEEHTSELQSREKLVCRL